MAITTTRVMRIGAVVTASLALCISNGVDAVTCAKAGGRPAPAKSTLMVSPTNDSVAWILHPNCDLDEVPVVNQDDTTVLTCTQMTVDVIESLPKAKVLFLDSTGLQSGSFKQPEGIEHVIIQNNRLETITGFQFPDKLEELDVQGNSILSIAKGAIPDKINYFYYGTNGLRTIANINLPSSMYFLSFKENLLVSLDFQIPDGLSILELSGNPMTTIENVTMPDSLKEFQCVDCKTTSFRGVKLSSRLTKIDFGNTVISVFEVRQSDLNILKTLETFNVTVSQTKCDDAEATLQIAQKVNVCVISDVRFAQKYSGSNSGTPSSTTTAPSPDASSPTSSSPSNDSKDSNATSSSSSSNSTLVIVISVITGVILVAVIAIGYRVYIKPKRTANKSASDNSNAYMETGMDSTLQINNMTSKSTGSSNANASEYLSNDIRNDEALIPYRINQDEIQLVKVIARGGYGVINYGRLRGRDVAVKQLLPERAKDMRVVKGFMDEIRLSSKLEHPKIVQFIGISWTTLFDLAAVIEFMHGGDLGLILNGQEPTSEQNHWFEPTSALKPKNLLALDVIEAIVYLHSYAPPIIHRDLKARNVLLTSDGDAKLSDFGISREVALEETMTGDVGTVAWIAPEVLQGSRYGAMADIYSFGVFMVELDRCRHPYSQSDDSQQSNTRIALLVSTGKLVPEMTPSCPTAIQELVKKCLSFNPSDRPTALEVHYELRKIQKAFASQYARVV